MVVVVKGGGSEETSRDVGGAGGVGLRGRSRGATVSGRGGRLVVQGREGMGVCGGQGEGGGAL